MAGPDFPYPRRRIIRRRSLPRSRRIVGSNLRLTPVMAVAVTALAGFQRFPGGAAVDAPVAVGMPFVRTETSSARDAVSARFGFCHSGGGRNCVVDGDTFWFAGERYRIADMDTPETHPARCAGEAALGNAATERLHEWLNAGAFNLENAERDADRYGRKLRIVTRDGESVGSALVAEGLARSWEGRRRSWC